MNSSKGLMTFGRIGVASSVSLENGIFDPFAALDYADQNRFAPVQVYLDNTLIQNAEMREQLRACARARCLPIMLHAPGLLRLPEVGDRSTIQAALHLLADNDHRRVVYHFDETEPVAHIAAATESICAAGITPCIENFHQLSGAENARRHYEQYLELLSWTRQRHLRVVPVFDIPRAFHQSLGLSVDDAARLTIDTLRQIGAMGYSVLLHLIDTLGPLQLRREWCAIGEGMIPYARIFRSVADAVQFDDVILEFEEHANPVPSRDFLNSLFSSLSTE